MDKKLMAADMKASIGAYPTKTKIARYMGWSRERVRKVTGTLPSLDGKGSQYFYQDVVEKIWEEMR